MEGQHFIVITDYISLKYIKTQHNISHRQARWLETLQANDFEVWYKPGKTNIVADALSQQSYLANITILSTKHNDNLKKKY